MASLDHNELTLNQKPHKDHNPGTTAPTVYEQIIRKPQRNFATGTGIMSDQVIILYVSLYRPTFVTRANLWLDLIMRINIRCKRFTRFQLLVDEPFVTWVPAPIPDVNHALGVTIPRRNGLISLLLLNMVLEGSVGYKLTHWGRVTHICIGRNTNIGSDNGLSPGRRQAIIWANAGILLIGSLAQISVKF